MKAHLDWTSSLPLSRFMTQDMPALTPVITAKLRACTNGPPARACNQSKPFLIYQQNPRTPPYIKVYPYFN